MTLIEALPKNAEGEVVIPVAAVDEDGNKYPGTTSAEFISNAFSVFTSKDVPLSDTEYQSLLDISSPGWVLNWQEFRRQGVI